MFLKSIIIGIIFFLGFKVAYSKQIQFIPDLIFTPTWKTKNLKAFKNLNGIWKTPSDEIYRVPFVEDELNQLTLRKEFFLKEIPKDTLYLYFEGISWESEIYLNGKLLSIEQKPFEEIVIKVPKNLFNVQWNWIEVNLIKYPNQTDEWWTPPYLGIYKSVFLLEKDYEKKVILSSYMKVDSVLIYFPFSQEFKYNIPEKDFVRDLFFLRSMGVKAIHIPYYISPKLRQLLNDNQIALVDRYENSKQVAIYRSHSETNVYPFWFKENNEKSNFFGNYVYINSTQLFKTVSELSKPLIVFLGLMVLFFLLIYRITNYENYKKLWNLFLSVRQIQALTNDFQLLSSFSLKYFYLVRIIIKSLIISLFINQLHLTDNLKILNIWHKQNTIYSFSKEYGESVFWSFMIVLMVLLIVNLVKISIWQFVEWVYNLKDYRNKNLIVEVYGEMPFIFYSLMGLLAMLLAGVYIGFVLFVMGYLLSVLKKQYFLISMYNLTYKIPLSAIFFYLCGFELLPWLLLI